MTGHLRALPDVRRGYADVGGRQVHYARAGAGGATVVLVHEVPRSWTQFGPAIPHLAEHAEVIAIDLPGYGASDPIGDRPTAEQYAEVLGGAIAQLAPGPVWLAGVHSGALFAAIVAARRHAEVDGLVLTGLPMFGAAGPRPASPPRDVLGSTYDGSHLSRLVPHFQAKWGDSASTHRLHDAAVQALQAVDRIYVAYDAVFDYDTARIVPELDCAVHFLSAERDGLFAHDLLAGSMLRHATMQVAHGIGRDLPWSAPQWYARRVLAALGVTDDAPVPVL